MSGYSRTGSRVNAITPNRMIVRLMTVAKTGRWMETSLIFIEELLRPPRLALDRDHLRAFEELLVSGADHRLPGCQTLHHLDRVGQPRAEGEGAPGHGAVGLHHVGERLVPLGEDGLGGN